MTTRKAFNKGEKVTYIASADGKGTFYFQQAIVESCGTKQMVLRNAETGELMGRHFMPEVGIDHSSTVRITNGTFKYLSDEEAVDVCLQEAAIYLKWKRAGIEKSIASAAIGSPYAEAMKDELGKLHYPEAIKR